MSEGINPFNRALGVNAASMMLNPMLPSGAQAADQMRSSYSARVAAYANDFILCSSAACPALRIDFPDEACHVADYPEDRVG